MKICSFPFEAADDWPLELYPRHGSMFGGHEVHMSGTCFTSPSTTRCRFGEVVTESRYDGNLMQVRCVSPMQDVVGMVKAAVSGDGGITFLRENDYVIGRYNTLICFPLDLVMTIGPQLRLDEACELPPETVLMSVIKPFVYQAYACHGHMQQEACYVVVGSLITARALVEVSLVTVNCLTPALSQ